MQSLRFGRNEHGKPSLCLADGVPGGDLQFNVTHSDSIIGKIFCTAGLTEHDWRNQNGLICIPFNYCNVLPQ
eukprot:scaffold361094_cov30-Prasinocladus_malaysianus.AAC.2